MSRNDHIRFEATSSAQARWVHRSRNASRYVRLLVAAAAAASVPQIGHAKETQSEDSAAPKDYAVFLGTDIFADADNKGKPLPVVGGSEGEVVVLNDNGTSVLRRSDVVFSAALEPKVSRGDVTIESIDGYPIHSPLTDPKAATHEQMISMANYDANRQEAAEGAARQAEASAQGLQKGAASMPDGEGLVGAMRDAAMAGAALAGQQTAGVVNMAADIAANPLSGDFLPGENGENGMFDGFKVVFRISAQEPHSNAYGVLQMSLRNPISPELGAQHAFQVFRLPALGPNPRKVVIRRFGLPLGFTVDSYQVFVYVDGVELATSLSKNRVEVTESEALQFLILQHTQRNKSASREAQVADELRPEWPRGELASDWENIVVTLHITPEGTVEDSKVSGAINSPLTEGLHAALLKIRFLPALAVGEPVPSTASFALGELFRSPTQRL